MRDLLRQAGRGLLALLWGAGGAAAVFLLLCAAGVVTPETLRTDRQEEPVPAAAWNRTESAPLRAAVLSPEETDRAARAAAGKDGVLVPMKEADGSLAWVSDLPLAADCGASFARPERNRALLAMNGTEGLYTVAEVSCLRDDALGRARPELTLKRPGGAPWRDEDGGWWLDPADREVLAYCIGLCRELADLGFDELLLTDCRYPPGGDPAETKERQKVLEDFCRRLQSALAAYPAVLSVQGAAAEDSGQTPALLASFSGRVWTAEGDGAALAAFRPAVIPEG